MEKYFVKSVGTLQVIPLPKRGSRRGFSHAEGGCNDSRHARLPRIRGFPRFLKYLGHSCDSSRSKEKICFI